MAFSETQGSENLTLEVQASAATSAVRIDGAEPVEITYAGWSRAAMPEMLRRLDHDLPAGDRRAQFANLIDNERIGLVDMDASVGGHVLATDVDARSRIELPTLNDSKWAAMRPRDSQGRQLTWEALRRVKSWLGGTGATLTVANAVPAPATVLLLLTGLVPLIYFTGRSQRRKAASA